MDSSSLTSDQARWLRARLAPMIKHLGRLIYRCRELEFPEHDPLLRAAVLAAMKLDELDREALRAALKHGDLKAADDCKDRDVRRV